MEKAFSFSLFGPKPKTAHGPLRAPALPHAQVATWAWAGNPAPARLPLGPDSARLASIALGRPIESDGHPLFSRIKPGGGRFPRKT